MTRLSSEDPTRTGRPPGAAAVPTDRHRPWRWVAARCRARHRDGAIVLTGTGTGREQRFELGGADPVVDALLVDLRGAGEDVRRDLGGDWGVLLLRTTGRVRHVVDLGEWGRLRETTQRPSPRGSVYWATALPEPPQPPGGYPMGTTFDVDLRDVRQAAEASGWLDVLAEAGVPVRVLSPDAGARAAHADVTARGGLAGARRVELPDAPWRRTAHVVRRLARLHLALTPLLPVGLVAGWGSGTAWPVRAALALWLLPALAAATTVTVRQPPVLLRELRTGRVLERVWTPRGVPGVARVSHPGTARTGSAGIGRDARGDLVLRHRGAQRWLPGGGAQAVAAVRRVRPGGGRDHVLLETAGGLLLAALPVRDWCAGHGDDQDLADALGVPLLPARGEGPASVPWPGATDRGGEVSLVDPEHPASPKPARVPGAFRLDAGPGRGRRWGFGTESAELTCTLSGAVLLGLVASGALTGGTAAAAVVAAAVLLSGWVKLPLLVALARRSRRGELVGPATTG
ncbi:hypothetical protein [Kineococcus arenarius]|uniref:hypothetical protein n=1 Tax=Kineococcus sp. SYSU DK007 TaxID=3383128 RepID=UPI003D7E5297